MVAKTVYVVAVLLAVCAFSAHAAQQPQVQVDNKVTFLAPSEASDGGVSGDKTKPGAGASTDPQKSDGATNEAHAAVAGEHETKVAKVADDREGDLSLKDVDPKETHREIDPNDVSGKKNVAKGGMIYKDQSSKDVKDASNNGHHPTHDHEVEPIIEGAEEGNEWADEEEEDGEEEGGEEGDEPEENGDEQMLKKPVKKLPENDAQEFDDDTAPASTGVQAKSNDVKVGRLKDERVHAAEAARDYDEDGDEDEEDQEDEAGDAQQTSKASVEKEEEENEDDTEDADDEAEDDRSDAQASGSGSAAAQASGSSGSSGSGSEELADDEQESTPESAARLAPEPSLPVALQAEGEDKIGTAPRRPGFAYPAPDLSLSVDWRGSFDTRNFIKVPHSEAISSASFSVMFWITLGEGPVKIWRNIVHKGYTNFQRTPSIWVEYGSNRLYASASTSFSSDETLTSVHRLEKGVPTHVAYVIQGRMLMLYINGVVDAHVKLQGDVLTNTGPLYIGKDPFYQGGNCTIHGFKWFSRALFDTEIRLESNRNREPAFVAIDNQGSLTGDSLSTVKVPHQPAFKSTDFSVMFWVRINEQPTGRPRSLVRKGFTDADRTPYVAVDPTMNQLDIRVSTTASDDEGFLSQRKLRVGQVYHVAYVRRGMDLSLFIDGELDNQIATRGHTKFNLGSMYFGKSPFDDTIIGDLTGIRYFNQGFNEKEIRLIASSTAAPPLRARFTPEMWAEDFVRLPHTPSAMESPDFTITFWINPQSGPTGEWRSIFHKGHSADERTPSMWLHPKTMQLMAEISTDYSKSKVFRLLSNNILPVKRPRHAGLRLRDGVLCIFVEGTADICEKVPGKVRVNQGPFFIGKSPAYSGFTGHISGFEYHPRALMLHELSPYKLDTPEPVFSYWNPQLGDHVMTINKDDFGSGRFGYQAIKDGDKLGRHESGEASPMGYAHAFKVKGTVPLFSYYNERSGDHWYTVNGEGEKTGYQLEGAKFYVFSPDRKGVPLSDKLYQPIYEHFSKKLGDYYYTPQKEISSEAGHSYTNNGIAFYLHRTDGHPLPLYQLYTPAADLGSTVSVDGTMEFNGWTKFSTSDLGYESETGDSSTCFWLRLNSAGNGFWRTIFHKGWYNKQRTPTMYLFPNEPRLSVRLSTDEDYNEGVDSNTILPLHQSAYICVVSHGQYIKLFVNGRLDASRKFKGQRLFNSGPFHVGRFPNAPGVDGAITRFRFYPYPLNTADVIENMHGDTQRPQVSIDYKGTWTKGARIPNSVAMQADTFSILGWYRMANSHGGRGQARTLFHKGNNRNEYTPSAELLGTEDRLFIRLQTTSGHKAHIISHTEFKVGSLYHIALVCTGNHLQLYIDGELDTDIEIAGTIVFNNGPLYVMDAPWSKPAGGELTRFRWFRRAVTSNELQQFLDESFLTTSVSFDWRGELGLGKHVVVPHNDKQIAENWAWSFWLTTKYDTTKKWRQVALKGEQHFEKAPQISWWPASGRIRVMVHTKGDADNFIHMTSKSSVIPNTPAHIALNKLGNELRLYINGKLEGTLTVKGMVESTKGISLGNLNAHVTNFRFTDHALLDHQIVADIYAAKTI
eukprot:TRINITY_DN922_c0_g1_i1.p1 TRINITY_DN922_c0_g1~~TRINITY_DN922_c0_g1_i1.p1  ORF type:complete len:1584 (+),score=618.06 TRINITY_DN922_c0_g1_i1:401-5152(+)